MPRSRRRGARLLSAVAALSMLGAMLPASAAALSTSVVSTLRWFSCTYNWQWQGPVDHILGVQNKGSFDHCFGIQQLGIPDSAGRIQDGDSRYDTYIGFLEIDWWTTSGSVNADNPMKGVITSSIAAVDGGYAATPTVFSSSACTQQPFSFSLGPIGVSLDQALCNNATLRRDSISTTRAQWSSNDVRIIKHMELAYLVKVNQGAKPKFTASTYYPYYTKFKDGGTYCGGGYCIPTWGYTPVMYSSTWVHTAP